MLDAAFAVEIVWNEISDAGRISFLVILYGLFSNIIWYDTIMLSLRTKLSLRFALFNHLYVVVLFVMFYVNKCIHIVLNINIKNKYKRK